MSETPGSYEIDGPFAEIARTRQHYAKAPAAFLSAWKEAVIAAGPQFFACQSGYTPCIAVGACTDKWQLNPNIERIEGAMGAMSVGERAFLVALCSFYNGEEATRLGEAFCPGYVSLGDLANRLDLPQLEILVRLMLHHTGW